MEKLNAAANRADNAVVFAEAREEELIQKIDAAHEAGNASLVASLQAEHQKVEAAVVDAQAELEIALKQVGDAQDFWYGDPDDDQRDDEDDDY